MGTLFIISIHGVKWDWWLSSFNFGGDLKTTFAESQTQFDEAIDFFDWDRSRAWYMDIAGSKQDFNLLLSARRIVESSSILSPTGNTLHTSEEKRNTRTLLLSGGN